MGREPSQGGEAERGAHGDCGPRFTEQEESQGSPLHLRGWTPGPGVWEGNAGVPGGCAQGGDSGPAHPVPGVYSPLAWGGGRVVACCLDFSSADLGSGHHMLMFYLNREELICMWQRFLIPQRSPAPPSLLSSPLCSSPISRLLLLLQNLLAASGMIKKSVYYTVLSKTNLTLAGMG